MKKYFGGNFDYVPRPSNMGNSVEVRGTFPAYFRPISTTIIIQLNGVSRFLLKEP